MTDTECTDVCRLCEWGFDGDNEPDPGRCLECGDVDSEEPSRFELREDIR